MTAHIREHSGDAYAAWEDVKVTRQGYANDAVQAAQKGPGIKRFADLVRVFRQAGEDYDRWQDERDIQGAA